MNNCSKDNEVESIIFLRGCVDKIEIAATEMNYKNLRKHKKGSDKVF